MFQYLKGVLYSRGLEIRRNKGSVSRVPTVHSGSGEPNLGAISAMLDFLDEIDPLYRSISPPEPLRIGGAWLQDLQQRRTNQLTAYKEKQPSEIARLHENMFFNELTAGLWNYGYYENGQMSVPSLQNFHGDLEEIETIWPELEYYSPPPL